MKTGYRIIDHTADVGLEVHGRNRDELFRQGAAGLIDLLVDRDELTADATRLLRVEGADPTDLWINYLREILYLFNGDGFLVREVEELTFTAPETDAAAATADASAGFSSAAVPTVAPAVVLPGNISADSAIPPAMFRDENGEVDAAAPNSVTGDGGRERLYRLTASCRGEDYDPARHVLKTEIKAVTYHHAEVRETPAGWRGVFIVDV